MRSLPFFLFGRGSEVELYSTPAAPSGSAFRFPGLPLNLLGEADVLASPAVSSGARALFFDPGGLARSRLGGT